MSSWEQVVRNAIAEGYRLIDTASSYQNEEAVGRAIRSCGVPREELFITTKAYIQQMGYENTKTAFEESLRKLGLEYLDLYLIHMPFGDYYGTSIRTADREGTIIFDGVKADGSKNDIEITGPIAQQTYYTRINDIDESSVYENSFIKLREIALSYPILKKKNIELNVNAFARNILIWATVPDVDPEASQGNNNMTGAFEDYSLPQTASYGFGFNLKF